MKSPPFPENEQSRLEALCSLKILDTEAEERFDRLTRIAKQHFNVPIVLISLIDADRQWFKSRQGLDAIETPRDISFCGHAILQSNIFYIPNALDDPRFVDNPLVTGPPNIRFYAGAPLQTFGGERIGTLCIIDDKPRTFNDEQLLILRDIANAVETELNQVGLLKMQATLAENELRLRLDNERLALATSAGNIGIWEYNIIDNILSWDDRMFTLYGVNRDQFPGCYEAWSSALHPEDKAASEQALNDAIAGIRPFDLEFRVIWPNEQIRYIRAFATVVKDQQGKPSRMIGVNQDITIAKNTMQSLRLYESIIQSSSDAIISKSTNKIIESWNPAAERIFGFSAKEAIGQPITMLLPPDQISKENDIMRRIYAGEKIDFFETVRLCKDGTLLDVAATISPVLDSEGRVVGASQIAHDITERKQIERLKSEFISTVSHELRTPLTSIRGALGLILGKASEQLPDKVKKMLEMANRNSERLTLLINDLLDLEKIESGQLAFEFEEIDLLSVAKQAVEDNAGFARQHNVELIFNSSLEEAWVQGDEHRLLQVFANLISNAVKYSPAGGKVEVKVRMVGREVEAGVQDHGSGIPEEFRSRMFGRFAQADGSDSREKGGTGLGLNITKTIIERHSGRINYETELGKGTRFYFDLPVVCERQRECSAQDGDSLVLICEDNKDVAEILAAMIEPEGLRCDIATTVAKARQSLSERNYKLLLLDLNLPDASGFSLLQEIRENPALASLPVIVISGQAVESKKDAASKQLMVVDWIQKPIDQARLLGSIQGVLSRSFQHHILHIEDDADILQITKVLIGDMAHLTQATTLAQARQMLAKQRFDLILLDLTLTDGSGVELIASLKDQGPIIIFSANSVEGNLATQVSATLTKSMTSNSELVQTIKKVLNQGA